MANRLLDLPAELRNHIYEYSLAEPLGLRFVEDLTGTGRLCLRQGHEYKDYLNADRSHVAIQEFPVLEGVIANQLQFVNRQLRKETKGLGIRVNTLIFASIKDHNCGVLRRFLAFVKKLPSAQHKHLSTVILKDRGAREWAPNLEGVSRFCRSHPRVTVRMHMWKTHPIGHDFILTAVLVKQVYRRDPLFVSNVTSDPWLQQRLLENNKKALSIVSALPANFRVFPAHDEFNETTFRHACAKDPICEDIAGTIAGGVDAWIPWIEAWFQDGF